MNACIYMHIYKISCLIRSLVCEGAWLVLAVAVTKHSEAVSYFNDFQNKILHIASRTNFHKHS